MSFNKVILNGKLPRFEARYTKGEGDKRSFLAWNISVKRKFKPEGAQYYPEDLLRFKAFGAKADFIMNNFAMGDGLMITGTLQVEDDYTDKDGNNVKGQMVIMVDDVDFVDGRGSEGKPAGTSTAGASKPAGVPGKPGVPAGKPGLPGVPGGKPAGFGSGRPGLPPMGVRK